MSRKRIWPIVRKVWIALGLSATVLFVIWSLLAYRASPEARAAAVSDDVVAVEAVDGFWHFTPATGPMETTRLVFFPGALVDPRAYAPLARMIAEAGYPVTLVELPRRGAFGGADSAELASRVRIALAESGPDLAIVVGGHSRGGVVASSVAFTDSAALAGLVLIGTTHPRDVDLSDLSMPVTKIVGTRDGLATRGEVERNGAFLPPQTRWLWIEGGNHSQFGWYGFQPMDRRPRIGASVQRRMMVDAVLEMLRNVSDSRLQMR